jgi:hypothetical protein
MMAKSCGCNGRVFNIPKRENSGRVVAKTHAEPVRLLEDL